MDHGCALVMGSQLESVESRMVDVILLAHFESVYSLNKRGGGAENLGYVVVVL